MQYYNLAKLIKFRQEMHQNPESAFNEYQTQKRIIAYLDSINVTSYKPCATTGLVVDLVGKAEPKGDKRSIAYRADIDALIMDEANHDLPYRSSNGCAHMCGHDGHTACLLGFASLFQDQVNQIPNNKMVRLLFQPAEERLGGAVKMIQEGCLEGIDEVYGFHQWPFAKVGYCVIKPGPFMAEPIIFDIEIKGKGGHASVPDMFNNPTEAGIEFLHKIKEILKEQQAQKKNFTFCFPYFQAGQSANVIPDSASIKGQIRNLEPGFGQEGYQIIKNCLEETVKKYGCTATINNDAVNYCLLYNTEKEAGHIERLGKQYFEKCDAGIAPVYASEDFGQFNKVVPGAFFFLSSGKEETNNPMVHQSNFNFNDDLIELASKFWLLIAQDRLGL